MEIDMREEAQKGRVSDINQGSGYFVLVFNYEKSYNSCNTSRKIKKNFTGQV